MVRQSAASFGAEVAAKLGMMLLHAADYLDSGKG
jgi:hypothetical protein